VWHGLATKKIKKKLVDLPPSLLPCATSLIYSLMYSHYRKLTAAPWIEMGRRAHVQDLLSRTQGKYVSRTQGKYIDM
jgi:hypothetical protein